MRVVSEASVPCRRVAFLAVFLMTVAPRSVIAAERERMTARGSMTDRRSIRARSLVAALLAVFLSGVAAKSSAPTCVSHAGYPDFLSHGKPPSKNRGLTFCQQYERSTCCDRGTTDGVRRVVAHMQANGFSPKCREVRDTSRRVSSRFRFRQGMRPDRAPTKVLFFLSSSNVHHIIFISVERTSRAKAQTSPLPCLI